MSDELTDDEKTALKQATVDALGAVLRICVSKRITTNSAARDVLGAETWNAYNAKLREIMLTAYDCADGVDACRSALARIRDMCTDDFIRDGGNGDVRRAGYLKQLSAAVAFIRSAARLEAYMSDRPGLDALFSQAKAKMAEGHSHVFKLSELTPEVGV